jgi:hypothetical protein
MTASLKDGQNSVRMRRYFHKTVGALASMLNKRHGAILGLLQEQGALSLAALAQALPG